MCLENCTASRLTGSKNCCRKTGSPISSRGSSSGAYNTITFFLRQILSDEAEGRIEPINEQTKFTIKSFISFVESDFKSSIEEELGRETTREIDYDFSEFKTKKQTLFSKESWSTIEQFQSKINSDYPTLSQRHSPTHPISIFIKDNNSEKTGKKIMSLTRTGRNVYIQLVYRNHFLSEDQKLGLQNFLKKFTNIEKTDADRIMLIKFKRLAIGDIIEIFNYFYKLLPK